MLSTKVTLATPLNIDVKLIAQLLKESRYRGPYVGYSGDLETSEYIINDKTNKAILNFDNKMQGGFTSIETEYSLQDLAGIINGLSPDLSSQLKDALKGTSLELPAIVEAYEKKSEHGEKANQKNMSIRSIGFFQLENSTDPIKDKNIHAPVSSRDIKRNKLENIKQLYEQYSEEKHFWRVFPTIESWRFFVEDYKQKKGILSFEMGSNYSEKNYFLALFLDIARTMGQDREDFCTEKNYMERHKTCFDKVITDMRFDGLEKPGEYRDGYRSGKHIYFEIIRNQSCSLEGLIENLKLIKTSSYDRPGVYDPWYEYYISWGSENINKKQVMSMSDEELTNFAKSIYNDNKRIFFYSSVFDLSERVNEAFSNYKREMDTASETIDKVIAITKLILTLERVHPFPDRNCMTNTRLLMDLCSQQGLPPPMLANANVFDSFSLSECVECVLEGMQNTLYFLSPNYSKNPNRNDINTLTNLHSLNEEERNYYNNIVETIKFAVHNEINNTSSFDPALICRTPC